MTLPSKPKILHVDDSEVFLEVFSMTFHRYFDICSVSSVDLAQKALQEENFDAVISDFDMPTKNGMELLKIVKENHPGMPVIFFTAQGNEEIAREVFEKGASDYYTKKLNSFAIREKISNSIKTLVQKRIIEQDLIKTKDIYKSVFESTGTAMLIVEDGMVVMSNKKIEEMTGRSRDEIEGNLHWKDIILPEDHDSFEKSLQKANSSESGEPSDTECRMVDCDGNVLYILATISLIASTNQLIVSFLDITSKKHAEKALRRERTMLDSIIRLNPFSIAIFDKEGRFLKGNEAYLNMFKVPPPPTYSLFNDPILKRNLLEGTINSIREGSPQETQGVWYNIKEIDPSMPDNPIFIRGKGFPILDDDGKLEYVITIQEDFTAQKNAESALISARQDLEIRVEERTRELAEANRELKEEIKNHRLTQEALRESEIRYKLISDISPDAIMVHDDDAILFLNPAGAKILGIDSPDEALGKSVIEFTHPIHRDKIQKIINDFKDPGNIIETMELNYIRHDGVEAVVEVRTALIDFDGRESVIMIIRDITQRRKAEKTLQEREERYSLAVRAGKTYVWEFWPESERLYYDENTREILGYKGRELPRKLEGWLNSIIHPEDALLIKEMLKTKKIDMQDQFQVPLRLVRRNGETGWFLVNGTKVERSGSPLRYVGTCTDITEEKIATDELEEREHRMTMMLEMIEDIVFLMSPDKKIKILNGAFEKITGFSKAQCIGNTYENLVHPDELPKISSILEEGMKNLTISSFDTLIKISSGEYIPATCKPTLIVKDGKVREIMGFLQMEKQPHA